MKFLVKQWIKMFVQQVALPLVYQLNRWRKVNPRYILFADAHHVSRPESMKYLYERLQKTDYEVEEIYRDYSCLGMLSLAKEMFHFMKLYAMAGTVVICDNFLPVTACHKKKETKVIQLWHGAGAYKKFGYDAADDIPPYYKGHVYRNYDLVTVSSAWCVKPFASAMRLDENVVSPLGVSRMDVYNDGDYKEYCRNQFHKLYPETRDKKILLWAPTFRGNAGNPELFGLESIQQLEKELGGEWKVIYSIHPHLAAHYDIKGFQCSLSTEQLIPVADVFMTDYSSVLFDAALLQTPIVLFTPDLQSFQQERGFYLDMKDIPGYIVEDANELKSAVSDTMRAYDKARLEQFIDKYLSACDGNATERIIDYIEKGPEL